MKKQLTLLLALCTLFGSVALGQSRTFDRHPDRSVPFRGIPAGEAQPRTPVNDTLFPPSFTDPCSNTAYSFTINNQWGYVAGMNGYGDKEKAQRLIFGSNGPYLVKEAWGFFAEAAKVNDGQLRMKIYSLHPDDSGPDMLLGQSDALKVSDLQVDPNDVLVTVFPFATPVTVTDTAFFVSCDLSALYQTQDTVSLLITDDDCGSGIDAWELFSDDTWVPINSEFSWGLDANFFLAAVIEFDPAVGVDDPFISQRGLTLYPAAPNPARDEVNLSYQLDQSTRVQIELYTADGRLLRRIDRGQQPAGAYAEPLDVSSLSPGAYVFGIVTDEARIMSRLLIQ